jgi:hypothetical protein
MNTVFRSKVDSRFKWIGLLMPCLALLALFSAQPGNRLLWIPVDTMSLATALVFWTLISTYYELQREQLVAHCGPFTWRIPLADNTGVRESNSMRSGPALSLDRLEIVHGGGKVLVISPADKAGFIMVLRRSARHL